MEKDLEEAIELLKDCWFQFAIENKEGKLWPGGLSTLEEVERFLKVHDAI